MFYSFSDINYVGLVDFHDGWYFPITTCAVHVSVVDEFNKVMRMRLITLTVNFFKLKNLSYETVKTLHRLWLR